VGRRGPSGWRGPRVEGPAVAFRHRPTFRPQCQPAHHRYVDPADLAHISHNAGINTLQPMRAFFSVNLDSHRFPSSNALSSCSGWRATLPPSPMKPEPPPPETRKDHAVKTQTLNALHHSRCNRSPLFPLHQRRRARPSHLDLGAPLDAFLKNWFTRPPKINFDFCIAFFRIYAIVYLFRLWRWFSKPEVVCVTGLPARTARPFVPSFFSGRLSRLTPQSLSPLVPSPCFLFSIPRLYKAAPNPSASAFGIRSINLKRVQ